MPPAKKTNTGGGDKPFIATTTTTTTAENHGNQSRKRKANSSSSSTKILDTSNWWSATQSSLPAGGSGFTLANFSLDCLRLLFDRIRRLPEALHLGLTCRRLFAVWEDVCKAKKKALEIVSETVFSVELERQRKAFDGCPNIDGDLWESQRRFTEHPIALTLPIEATTTELHLKPKKRQPSKRRKQNAGSIPPVLECPQNALQAIGRSFTHLHCLQLSIDLNSADWRPLLRQLFHSSSSSSSSSSSFPQLTTLTLCPHFFDSHATASPDYFWRPLSAELTAAQVPALRHLTLNIRSGLWSGGGQTDNERVRPAVVRRRRQRAAPVAAPQLAQPPYQAPPLPLLQQLASFAYNCEAEPFSETCRLIRQLMLLDGDAPAYGAHLAPGTGARFGGRLFKDRCPHDPTNPFPPVCTCTDLYQTPAAALFEPATLLPYFTYLEVQVGGWEHLNDPAVSPAHRDAVGSLLRALPQMTCLQKVELTVGQMVAAGETDTPHFPRLYEALLSLPHLQDLSIGCHQYPTNPTLWPSTSGGGGSSGLPVSATVRHLSLVYSSSAHVDIVQLFSLEHCFPALRTLHVHFYQHNCRHCTTASEENRQPSCLERALPAYQACGRELCRGLTGLQTAAAARGRGLTLQVEFTFLGHPFAHFSSLEKLWKGVPG